MDRSAREELEAMKKIIPGSEVVAEGPGFVMLQGPRPPEPEPGTDRKPRLTEWTEAMIAESVADWQKIATSTIEKDGHHIPITFLFCTWNPIDKRNECHILPVYASRFDSEHAKDGLSNVIKREAQEMKAVGVVFISEAWVLKCKTLEERTEWKGSLEHHPDRVEAVIMEVETSRYGCTHWSAEITRDAEKKVKLLPWESVKADVRGRFTHLLPTSS